MKNLPLSCFRRSSALWLDSILCRCVLGSFLRNGACRDHPIRAIWGYYASYARQWRSVSLISGGDVTSLWYYINSLRLAYLLSVEGVGRNLYCERCFVPLGVRRTRCSRRRLAVSALWGAQNTRKPPPHHTPPLCGRCGTRRCGWLPRFSRWKKLFASFTVSSVRCLMLQLSLLSLSP